MTPDQLRFSKSHEWVNVQQGVATVGISKFAVESLTDLVFIELPEVGRKLTAGQPFGVVESVKAVSDLYAPVDGEVVAVNSKLADKLDTLSSDPYGEGWMIKIQVSNDAGLKQLLDYHAYQKQCAEESH